jgi:peptide chain release factor
MKTSLLIPLVTHFCGSMFSRPLLTNKHTTVVGLTRKLFTTQSDYEAKSIFPIMDVVTVLDEDELWDSSLEKSVIGVELPTTSPKQVESHRDMIVKTRNEQLTPVPTEKILKREKQTIVILEEDLIERFVRGSGPGGQSVNKTNNCVQLLHIPTGIEIHCHETRDRVANRKIARTRLKDKLDFLVNQELSKFAKRKQLIQRRKSKASQRAKKKYDNQVLPNPNDDVNSK